MPSCFNQLILFYFRSIRALQCHWHILEFLMYFSYEYLYISAKQALHREFMLLISQRVIGILELCAQLSSPSKSRNKGRTALFQRQGTRGKTSGRASTILSLTAEYLRKRRNNLRNGRNNLRRREKNLRKCGRNFWET